MKFSNVRFLVKDYEKNFKCLRINILVFSFLTAVIFMFSVSCRTISSSSPSYVATKIGNALLEGDMEAVLIHIFIGDEFTMKFKGISFS